MSVEKLNMHYSMTNPASIYDEEALTALKLAGRTAQKVNECVEEVNQIPAKIADDVQTHINAGEFDDQIDRYAGELKKQIADSEKNIQSNVDTMENTLLGQIHNVNETLGARINAFESLPAGSTSLDAEVIDGRVTWDGETKVNIGTAIRSQFERSLKWITHPENYGYDANAILINSFCFVSSGNEWVNIPLGKRAGLLITCAGSVATQRYQIFVDYVGGSFYSRTHDANAWKDWINSAESINALSLTSGWGVGDVVTVDDCKAIGLYPFGSAFEHDAPENAGMLWVSSNSMGNQVYQLFTAYSGTMYYRNLKNTVWTNWKKFAFAVSSDVTPTEEAGREYTILKESETAIAIYKKGARGYVRYRYIRDVRSDIHLDTVRLESVAICDTNKAEVLVISDSGADVEGVVLLSGENDHVGGVHGDESLIDYTLFVDGKPYTFETIPNTVADNIMVIANTEVTHENGGTVCMNKNKRVIFDREGVHVKCRWTATETIAISSVRGAMFSIDKSCFTHWFDSNVNLSPIARTGEDEDTGSVTTDELVTDIYYVGLVMARHWVGARSGLTNNMSTLVTDYGTRYKSYFNNMDNTTVKAGTSFDSENNFYITY